MIVTITLNPCIDKTIYLEQLDVGSYNRVFSTRVDISGKGVNVSTALSHFGLPTHCLGLNFRDNGRMLEEVLKERGVSYDFVMANGAIRTNIKLFDRSCSTMTEINEAGPFVPPQTVELLLDHIQTLLDQTSLLILSGSIPPGVPADIYKKIISTARAKGVKTILDAAGEPFLQGLEASPFLIKPNTFEFEQAFGEDLQAGLSMVDIARKVIQKGTSYVCISMGEEGAMLIDKDHAYHAKPLNIIPRGLTGAGDSMVAGICYALYHQLDTRDMLRYAMAAAAGSIRLEGTLLASLEDLQELLPQVEIEEL